MSNRIINGVPTRSGLCFLIASLVFGLLSSHIMQGQVVNDLKPILPSHIEPDDLDASIPMPEMVIGHPVGSQSVRYDPLMRYLTILAETSDLVTMTQYAQSHEGRALVYLTITSPANHARLDEIKANNAKLADPRTRGENDDLDAIASTLPGIAWLAYSIHGDEVSGVDAAMQVAYLLAAARDDDTKRLLDEVVILIDPIENPDGRERYLSQIDAFKGKVPNPDRQAMHHAGPWAAGRGNHYLFDMNRDWLIQSQPETRGRTNAINEWNPHFLIDAHEMGSLDTFLMDPPRDPINNQMSETMMTWRRKFGADQGAAFNQRGWSYYSGDWYEEWYPGYTNAYASLRGTIGLLYEQAGVNGSMIRKNSGEIETYFDAVAHNVVGSMANLMTLRDNRAGIIRDFLAEKRWALSDADDGARTYILPPDADIRRWKKHLMLLDQHEIEYTIATNEFEAINVSNTYGEKAERKTFPAGTAVVKSTQPFRRYLNTILDFNPRMTDQFLKEEREEIENDEGGRIYDMTAWSVPMAYGLEAYWAERVEGDTSGAMSVSQATPPAMPSVPDYGYLIDGQDSIVYWALARLFEADCKPRVATKKFTHNGRAYQPGTVLIRRHENPEHIVEVLTRCREVYKMEIIGAETALSDTGPDLGGPTFQLLNAPKIAIASQWPMSTTSFGFAWYQFDDRLALRTSPFNVQNISFVDLRSYNVLILPSGGALSAVLNRGGMENLRQWVEAGGTLIAIGGSASTLAREGGLSSVRSRRNVLDKLEEYGEALAREIGSMNVQVDPADIWGDPVEAAVAEEDDDDDDEEASEEDDDESEDDDAKKEDTPKKLKGDALKRHDAWLRRFSPQGIFAQTRVDNRHWLAFGVKDRLPVLFSGSTVLMSKRPIKTPVRLVESDNVRMSGLLWPEGRERIGNAAYATVERMGNGQVILFANDPYLRAYTEGSGRLMLNAVLLGPGLGANPPIPW
ncbi:MAG: M14 family metallopeptidase [Planctomycetota bacterium]|nr:M14 family metallopeptidase [Planctomycetota bacterium]